MRTPAHARLDLECVHMMNVSVRSCESLKNMQISKTDVAIACRYSEGCTTNTRHPPCCPSCCARVQDVLRQVYQCIAGYNWMCLLKGLSKTALDDCQSACQSHGSRKDQPNDDLHEQRNNNDGLRQQRNKLSEIGHTRVTSDEASLLSSFSSESNVFTHGGHSMDAASLTRLLVQRVSAFKPPETVDDRIFSVQWASRYRLNEEQMRAFQIICSHLLNHYKDLRDNKYIAPLRMCLTGEGGTGKTVMKAVKACSAELRCRHWLSLAALTGVCR